MINAILGFLRVVIYLWAFYELGTLGVVYYSSYRFTHKQGVLGLALLMLAFIAFLVVLIFLNMSIHWIPIEYSEMVRNLLIIPSLGVVMATRFIKENFHNGHS